MTLSRHGKSLVLWFWSFLYLTFYSTPLLSFSYSVHSFNMGGLRLIIEWCNQILIWREPAMKPVPPSYHSVGIQLRVLHCHFDGFTQRSSPTCWLCAIKGTCRALNLCTFSPDAALPSPTCYLCETKEDFITLRSGIFSTETVLPSPIPLACQRWTHTSAPTTDRNRSGGEQIKPKIMGADASVTNSCASSKEIKWDGK